MQKKLENVQWFIRPLHIGDTIRGAPWRVMFEITSKVATTHYTVPFHFAEFQFAEFQIAEFQIAVSRIADPNPNSNPNPDHDTDPNPNPRIGNRRNEIQRIGRTPVRR